MEDYLTENNTMFNTTEEVPTMAETLNKFLNSYLGMMCFVSTVFLICIAATISLIYLNTGWDGVKKCMSDIMSSERNVSNQSNNKANEGSSNSTYTIDPAGVIAASTNSSLDKPATISPSQNIYLPS